jgi:hypothetical protein
MMLRAGIGPATSPLPKLWFYWNLRAFGAFLSILLCIWCRFVLCMSLCTVHLNTGALRKSYFIVPKNVQRATLTIQTIQCATKNHRRSFRHLYLVNCLNLQRLGRVPQIIRRKLSIYTGGDSTVAMPEEAGNSIHTDTGFSHP